MKKRGQVTLFIVIGTLVLLASGIVFYTKSSTVPLEQQRLIIIENLPTQFLPVNNFIENCIRDKMVKAFTKIGETGGFISLEENSIISLPDPTASSAVEFLPGSSLKTAYWHYMESDNSCIGDCSFVFLPENRLYLHKKAGKVSVEEQVSGYIEESISSCLELDEFEEQGFEFKADEEPKAKTSVRDSDIVITVDYPIDVKKGQTEKTIPMFIVQLPLNFNKIYQLASTIASLESEFRFIERDTLNLIVGFSGLNKEKLPPMSALDFDAGPGTTWRFSKVKENLKNMLASYMPLLQVQGTSNYNPALFQADSIGDSLYNYGMLVPLEQPYPELSVDFSYINSWEPYFRLNCNGEFCRPESVTTNVLSLVGFKKYNFVYDLSFPVLVEIKDESALSSKGYTFRFFLESNIRRNEPMESNFISITGFTERQTSMLCDEDKRNSGNVTVTILDSETEQPLDDVYVSFACTDETCSIGSTGSDGRLKSSFPVCIGGVATFAKDDYLTLSVPLNTELDKDDAIQKILEPFREKEIVVMKKRLVKQDDKWVFNQNPLYLYDKEQAIITLTRRSLVGEQEHTAVLVYNQSNYLNNKVKLAPGTYDAKINLMLYDNLTIPGGEICYCDGTDAEVLVCEAGKLIGIEPETCDEIEDIVFNETSPYSSGGLDLSINFDRDDLYNSDQIVFYVISPDLKAVREENRKLQDLEQVGKITDYSKKYASHLQPDYN